MEEVQYRASRLFKVLANPLTYQVVTLLRKGASRPGDLALVLGRPLTSVTRVGRELKIADVISFESDRIGLHGRRVRYQLKDPALSGLLDSAETWVRGMGARA